MNRPSGFWIDLFLGALDRLGGEADLFDIIQETDEMVELTPREMGMAWGRPRYAQTVRTTAGRLTRDGRAQRVCYGRYRLPGMSHGLP